MPQFLEKCGPILEFNCQPVEKKNHEQSRMFHRATQKGGSQSKYTIQVMEKENRKLFARVNHLERTRRSSSRKDVDNDRGSVATYQNNQEEG